MLEKCIYGFYACAIGLLSYYNIDSEGLLILTLLMTFDVIFWVAKSFVLEWADNPYWFSTHRLKVWVISKLSIFCIFILFWILLQYVTGSSSTMNITTSWILAIFIVAEFISVLQNVIMIRTWKEIAEWDALSYWLSMLYNKVADMFKIVVSSKKD